MTLNNEARLRPADMGDAGLILEWVNDPLDRANSYCSDPITPEEHMAWMERSLADPGVRLYMMEVGGEPAGHIKLYIEGGEAEIGYCIGPEWRGRGLAKAIVALVTIEAAERLPEVRTLVGWVKESNPASRKAFLRTGYDEEGPVDGSYRYSFDVVGYPEKKDLLMGVACGHAPRTDLERP